MPSETNNFAKIQDITQLSINLGNIDSGDINDPYNFLDWKLRAGIVKPDQLFNAYNDYLRNWYNKRNIVRNVPTTHIFKQEYISLLKELTLTLNNSDEQRFLQNLNYNNDIDLAIAIPFFAKQLKQIALYLSGKRETVKATKLKYSMAGTSQAIEKVIYQHLLTAFTKKKYPTHIYDPTFYINLPQLSAVNSFLNIKVEPLYDESNYFDSDVNLPVSIYTGTNDFEFINPILDSILTAKLNDTRNYNITATNIQNKYLGVSHLSISADNIGNITETILNNPSAPYAHLDNRYFSTVASIPNSNNIKSQEEIGGYFISKALGVSTYLATTKVYEYNLNVIIPGVNYNIPDPLFINHGRSLTLNDQVNIVLHDKNLDWVKAKDTNSYYEGFIINPRNIQKFIPYESKFESFGIDTQGTTRTTDRFDFWIGDLSDIWSESLIYPLTWRNEFNIDTRKVLLQITDKKLHNWTTDTFGNHYAIYKDYTFVGLSGIGVYDKLIRNGEVWVRNVNNIVLQAPNALTNIYDKYATINTTIFNTLTSNNIRNINIIYNTLILEINGYILTEQLDYDYNIDSIIQGVGGNNIISLSCNNNYGGFWFNQNENSTTFCVMTSATSGSNLLFYPLLYKLDLDTSIIRQIFPPIDQDLSSLIIPNSITIVSYERPVITYNNDTKIYNVAFLSFDGTGKIHLHSVDLLEVNKFKSIITNIPIIYT